MTRPVPTMTTDEEAEAFLDQDLTDLDCVAFEPLASEAEPSRPAPSSAASPDQRPIREAIERAVRR